MRRLCDCLSTDERPSFFPPPPGVDVLSDPQGLKRRPLRTAALLGVGYRYGGTTVKRGPLTFCTRSIRFMFMVLLAERCCWGLWGTVDLTVVFFLFFCVDWIWHSVLLVTHQRWMGTKMSGKVKQEGPKPIRDLIEWRYSCSHNGTRGTSGVAWHCVCVCVRKEENKKQCLTSWLTCMARLVLLHKGFRLLHHIICGLLPLLGEVFVLWLRGCDQKKIQPSGVKFHQ